MPRPKDGYVNSAGRKIPGVTDIVGRFKNGAALARWQFNRGWEGGAQYGEDDDRRKQLWDDWTERDIGTCSHHLFELDLAGADQGAIEHYIASLPAALPRTDARRAVMLAYQAFRNFRAAHPLRLHRQELSMVSERHQFGLTLDAALVAGNAIGIWEFKAGKVVYQDHAVQLAGYSIGWEENHPNEPVTGGYHVLILPKTGKPAVHREFSREELEPYREYFLALRNAYDLDRRCDLKKPLAVEATVMPRVRVKAPSIPMPCATMAELLRSYGHLTNGATA